MRKLLPVLMLVYGAASLVHFIHNAEFLADYPGLPVTWTRAGVYSAWAAMSALGFCGWLLVSRGYPVVGLLLVAVYAALGMDSLGHYVLAPMSAHSPAMNATILLEVSAAALVFLEAARLMVLHVASRRIRAS
ncbi:hypothetical protein BWI17_03600 [Betaproteobacteria bacterium GR16-43]|nr:hypothetical protein BWI17_03600 [Betaproteobacteria bacterium GR16-43]